MFHVLHKLAIRGQLLMFLKLTKHLLSRWLHLADIQFGSRIFWLKNWSLHETLQSHRCDVAEPRDRRGEQNPVASPGRFQMVQKNDDGQRRRDGTQDI